MKNHIYFKFSGIEVAMVSPAYSRFLHGFSSLGHATSILKWQNEKGSLTQNVSWIFFITQSQHTHAHTHTHSPAFWHLRICPEADFCFSFRSTPTHTHRQTIFSGTPHISHKVVTFYDPRPHTYS